MSHGFEYRIAAIPTLYNGIEYRSRLEAKWAAYFTLIGWQFQYEPFDLDGWIPDFLIKGPKDILVEVKPFYKKSDFEAEAINILRRHPTFEGDILLVGTTSHPLISIHDPEPFKGYWDIYDKEYDLDSYCIDTSSVILGWIASNNENWEGNTKLPLDGNFRGVDMSAAILGYYDDHEFDFCRYGSSDYWSTIRYGHHIRDMRNFNKVTPEEDLIICRKANRETQYHPGNNRTRHHVG